MTFVVTDACIQCRHTDCVEVCPMMCFHEGPNFLAIDPDQCIDCSMCVPMCPVGAIYSEHDLPDDKRQFIALNAELSRLMKEADGLPDKMPLDEGIKSGLPDQAIR